MLSLLTEIFRLSDLEFGALPVSMAVAAVGTLEVEDEANIGSLIVPRSSKLADEDIDECKLSTAAVSF